MAERPRGGGEKARNLTSKINPNFLKIERQSLQDIQERYNISEETVTHLASLQLQQQQQNTSFDSTAYRELLAMEIQEKATDGEITVIASKDTNKEYNPDDFKQLLDLVLEIRQLHESTHNELANLKDTRDYVDDLALMTAGIYSKDILDRVKNPDHTGDQILGMVVGIGETLVVAVTATGQIIWGIIKSPYDLYQLLTGKAKIESRIDI